jgi:hypothetical protein
MFFVSRWPAQRRASKTTTGKNLPGMSENSVRQALTRQTGFALHGANQSQELVAITPYDRCRSSTITTIIQHSAENLHENTRDEATQLRVLTGYLWLVLGLASFFTYRIQSRSFFARRISFTRHKAASGAERYLSRLGAHLLSLLQSRTKNACS